MAIVDDYAAIHRAMRRQPQVPPEPGQRFIAVDIDKLTPADIDSIARWLRLEMSGHDDDLERHARRSRSASRAICRLSDSARARCSVIRRALWTCQCLQPVSVFSRPFSLLNAKMQ